MFILALAMLIMILCGKDTLIVFNGQSIVENTISEKDMFSGMLPERMEIPDAECAQYPELTHIPYKYYYEPSKTYTEKEKEILLEHQESDFETVCLSSRDVAEYMKCYFNIVADNHYFFFIETAYKQEDSNLYIGDLTSFSGEAIGKFILSYQGDQIVISIKYDNQEQDREKGAYLTEGIHYYEKYIIWLEKRSIEKAGKQVMQSDYSSYSGKWIPQYPVNSSPDERYVNPADYMELEISSDGIITGILSHYEGEEKDCSYAGFSGFIENGIGIAEYNDDGYGHSGELTFTFYENGVKVYVNERGEPNFDGFIVGNNYYFRPK